MDVMDNWLNKSGYPVVTVSKISENRFNLTQERFFLVKPVNQDTTQWYIPITYVKEEAPNDIQSFWMIPEEPKIATINVSNWILFNKNQTGTDILIYHCSIFTFSTTYNIVNHIDSILPITDIIILLYVYYLYKKQRVYEDYDKVYDEYSRNCKNSLYYRSVALKYIKADVFVCFMH